MGGCEGANLKYYTLTNFQRPSQQGRYIAFAPRLDQLHRAVDEAVWAAYGWPPDILNDDEKILRRLLELNLKRAGQPHP